MGTRVVKTDTAEEADLMREFFETVQFDEEPEGLPPHPDGDSEEDEDEDPEMEVEMMKALVSTINTLGANFEKKLITPGGRIGSDRKLGSRRNGENWVERTRTAGGSLPQYIRIVRNGLMKQGHSQSKATAMAVAAMKRWARGGDNVTPKVQAAAAVALAQWEAMKAEKSAEWAADLASKSI